MHLQLPRQPGHRATVAQLLHDHRTKLALRVSGRSEGVEEGPVGFADIQQGSDPVVGEVGESEGDAFDAFEALMSSLWHVGCRGAWCDG